MSLPRPTDRNPGGRHRRHSKLRRVSVAELEELIRPSGFYTRKALALKAFMAMLDEEFEGSLEVLAAQSSRALRERLLALPGVGPETADAILLYALGHAVPVADEYLRRIAERHQLLERPPQKDRRGYESLAALTRQAFAEEVAEGHAQFFNEFHALTVAVGKAHCGRRTREVEQGPTGWRSWSPTLATEKSRKDGARDFRGRSSDDLPEETPRRKPKKICDLD